MSFEQRLCTHNSAEDAGVGANSITMTTHTIAFYTNGLCVEAHLLSTVI